MSQETEDVDQGTPGEPQQSAQAATVVQTASAAPKRVRRTKSEALEDKLQRLNAKAEEIKAKKREADQLAAKEAADRERLTKGRELLGAILQSAMAKETAGAEAAWTFVVDVATPNQVAQLKRMREILVAGRSKSKPEADR